MPTLRNIGLIDCSTSPFLSGNYPVYVPEESQIIKALMADNGFATYIQAQNPHVELVFDLDAIIDDTNIDLVIIAAPKPSDQKLVQKVLFSGKQVQVLQHGISADSKMEIACSKKHSTLRESNTTTGSLSFNK